MDNKQIQELIRQMPKDKFDVDRKTLTLAEICRRYNVTGMDAAAREHILITHNI